MKTPTFAALLALAIAVSGCIWRSSEPEPGPLPPLAADTRVDVTNNNWLDMVIYASRNGSRIRLGTVTSLETESFAMPPSLEHAGELRLIASPIGRNGSYSSDPVSVWPGQRVAFTIENQIGISTISVR